MAGRDYTPLLAELAEAYARRAPRSAALNEAAKQVLVDGGSHTPAPASSPFRRASSPRGAPG